MMEDLKLYFFLKQPNRKSADQRMFVYLRITVGASRPAELSLKRRWPEDRWDWKLERPKGTKEDAKTLTRYLDDYDAKVHKLFTKMSGSGDIFNSADLKAETDGSAKSQRSVLQLFKEHNDNMEKLTGPGKDYAEGTLERYCTSYRHTANYIKWRYKNADMDLNRLNYEFIEGYELWLKAVRKCGHNTTMKYLANFKKIILIAVKRGWLSKDPFAFYSLTKKQVDKEPLSYSEVLEIQNKEITLPRLALVRDAFIFSCYTGLSYADLKKFRRPEIFIGIDGNQWISSARQKTSVMAHIPLLQPAIDVLKKYEDHPLCQDKGLGLPILSNQKMNGYLKEIADICGITKPVTFHIARHTFATTIALGNGVPMETVSKLLGHSSIKHTQHYAKVMDAKISAEISRVREVLERAPEKKKTRRKKREKVA